MAKVKSTILLSSGRFKVAEWFLSGSQCWKKNGTMAEIRVYGTDRRRHFPGAAFICTIWKEEKERGYLYWLSDADEISFGKYRSRFFGTAEETGSWNHKWVISSGCRESKPGGTGDTSGRAKKYVSDIYGCE